MEGLSPLETEWHNTVCRVLWNQPTGTDRAPSALAAWSPNSRLAHPLSHAGEGYPLLVSGLPLPAPDPTGDPRSGPGRWGGRRGRGRAEAGGGWRRWRRTRPAGVAPGRRCGWRWGAGGQRPTRRPARGKCRAPPPNLENTCWERLLGTPSAAKPRQHSKCDGQKSKADRSSCTFILGHRDTSILPHTTG